MPDEYAETTFAPLRNTGQMYIPQALADHPRLGFDPGDPVRLRVLECGAILAWRAGDLPTDTLVVPPPNPAELPWALSSTGTTYAELADAAPPENQSLDDTEREERAETDSARTD